MYVSRDRDDRRTEQRTHARRALDELVADLLRDCAAHIVLNSLVAVARELHQRRPHPAFPAWEGGMSALAARSVTWADPLQVLMARAEARGILYREGELNLHDAVDVLQRAAP